MHLILKSYENNKCAMRKCTVAGGSRSITSYSSAGSSRTTWPYLGDLYHGCFEVSCGIYGLKMDLLQTAKYKLHISIISPSSESPTDISDWSDEHLTSSTHDVALVLFITLCFNIPYNEGRKCRTNEKAR